MRSSSSITKATASILRPRSRFRRKAFLALTTALRSNRGVVPAARGSMRPMGKSRFATDRWHSRQNQTLLVVIFRPSAHTVDALFNIIRNRVPQYFLVKLYATAFRNWIAVQFIVFDEVLHAMLPSDFLAALPKTSEGRIKRPSKHPCWFRIPAPGSGPAVLCPAWVAGWSGPRV